MTDAKQAHMADLPETADLVGLLNSILIQVGTSVGDRNYICGRFAELTEQRGYCVLDRLAKAECDHRWEVVHSGATYHDLKCSKCGEFKRETWD